MTRTELNYVCAALDSFINEMKECPEKQTLLDLLMQFDIAAEDAERREELVSLKKVEVLNEKVVRVNFNRNTNTGPKEGKVIDFRR